MIHKLSCRLAILSMESNDSFLANKKTYIYGFEILIMKAVTYSILLIIGLTFELLPEMIVFMVFLMLLRGQTGGFHLQTTYGCIFYSIIISLFSILVADNMKPKIALTGLPIFLILSSISIIIYSPVNHPNLNLTMHEVEKCKKLSRLFLLIELIIIVLLLLVNVKPSIIISACLAIILVAISLISAKFNKKEVSKHG